MADTWRWIRKKNYLEAKETTPAFFVYILECDDNTYYTGYTQDLIQRVTEHKMKLGANYTKKRGGIKLVYFEAHPTKKQALGREQQIKKAGRTYKQILIKKFRINLDHFKGDLLI